MLTLPKIRWDLALLRFWHAWLAGSYLVAYVTADEDTYAMHLFAGYAVLAAIAVRLLAGVAAPRSVLRLPKPSPQSARQWLSRRQGRHPLFAWLAAALLVGIGLSALTGALADVATWLEDPHEAVSEVSLWLIFGHVAFVTWMYGGRRLLARSKDWLSPLRPLRKESVR